MLKTGADSLIGIILGMLRPRRATESPLCREVAQGGPRRKCTQLCDLCLFWVLLNERGLPLPLNFRRGFGGHQQVCREGRDDLAWLIKLWARRLGERLGEEIFER